MDRRHVLLICTGNAARSQMAEGFVRHFLSDRWEASSAGTRPAGYVHPLAIRVMREVGIDIAAQRSKSVDEFKTAEIDLVITVCDSAAEECPVWIGNGPTVHMGFPDPGKVTGSPQQQLQAFREIRDDIRSKLIVFLSGWVPEQVTSGSG